MPGKILLESSAVPITATLLGPAGEDDPDRQFREFVRKLSFDLGRRDDFDDPDLQRWVNDGYNDIATMVGVNGQEESFGFDLVVGESIYYLPENIETVSAATLDRDTTSFSFGPPDLTKTSMSFWRQLYEDRGCPQRFFKHKRFFVVWPEPDRSYRVVVDATANVGRMKKESDVPAMDRMWDKAIELSAREHGHSSLREWADAAAARNEKVAYIRTRIDKDAKDREGTEAAVQPVKKLDDLYGSHYHGAYLRR